MRNDPQPGVLPVAALDSETVAEVLGLLAAADAVDGAYPVSEPVLLRLRSTAADPTAVHLLLRDHERLAGYAHLSGLGDPSGAVGELVVHPLSRRRGLGSALVRGALDLVDRHAEPAGSPGELRLWAHGDHPSATAVALSLGFERWRVLWQLRRSLREEIGEPRLPEGVRLRTFRPGDDDQAWLALNAEAFADHPEQGAWTAADLTARMAEPWFSPDGFFLAERVLPGRPEASQLIGFHWTKVPDATTGEVYVLGVSPSAGVSGLGTALTLAGLRHLRSLGLTTVTLYVDEANPRAVALYRKLGFAHWSTDICFRRRVDITSTGAQSPGTIGS